MTKSDIKFNTINAENEVTNTSNLPSLEHKKQRQRNETSTSDLESNEPYANENNVQENLNLVVDEETLKLCQNNSTKNQVIFYFTIKMFRIFFWSIYL